MKKLVFTAAALFALTAAPLYAQDRTPQGGAAPAAPATRQMPPAQPGAQSPGAGGRGMRPDGRSAQPSPQGREMRGRPSMGSESGAMRQPRVQRNELARRGNAMQYRQPAMRGERRDMRRGDRNWRNDRGWRDHRGYRAGRVWRGRPAASTFLFLGGPRIIARPGWCRGLHRGRHWAPGIGYHSGRHRGLFRC